ncbi:MAG: hypothetical protein AAFZ99_06350, partial [Pseudomonadota bacterium]
NSGTVASLNNSGGEFTNTGTISGTSTITAGTLDMDSGTAGAVTNSGGTVELGGGTVSGIDNTAGNTFVTAGNVDGDVNVNGGLVDQSGGTLENNVTVAGGTLTTTGGTIQGNLTQTSGTTNLGNTVQGDATHNGGTFNLNAAGVVQGTFNNNNAFTFSGGSLNDVTNTDNFVTSGAQTVNGTFQNSGGTLDVSAGNTLTAGSVTNDGAGSSIALTGILNSDVTSTNGSTIDVSGTGGTIGGTLTLGSGGTANLQEVSSTYTPTTLTVNGAGASNLDGGTLAFDVGTNGSGGVLSDSFVFAGAITGQVNLDLNIDSGLDTETGTATLATSSDSTGLTFGSLTATQDGSTVSIGAPASSITVGALQYGFTNTGTGIDLTVELDGGIANLAAGVGLTQSVVGSIVNRPTSPYVTDYVGYTGDSRSRRLKKQASSADPCGVGGWARVSGGSADVEGSISFNGGAPSASSQDLNYYSIQTGGDIACFDDRFNGFDMAFGLLAGYSTGDTTSTALVVGSNQVDTILDTDFSQTYAGVYATASRGSFFADLQLRFENLDYEVDVTNQFLENGTLDEVTDFSSSATTLSGAIGYSWQIPSVEGLSFVGTTGFSYTEFETDSTTLTSDSTSRDSSTGNVIAAGAVTDRTLQLEDSSIELGFVSGTLSMSRVLPDEISAINYFGTVTYYNDFADAPTATLIEPTSTGTLELSNLGSYGEISLGVNYIRLLNTGSDGKARQLSAAARVDYRSGSNVDSYGITGQVRIQF